MQDEENGKKRTVEMGNSTQFELIDEQNELQLGMDVDIWGNGIPFSLNVNAETVVEIGRD